MIRTRLPRASRTPPVLGPGVAIFRLGDAGLTTFLTIVPAGLTDNCAAKHARSMHEAREARVPPAGAAFFQVRVKMSEKLALVVRRGTCCSAQRTCCTGIVRRRDRTYLRRMSCSIHMQFFFFFYLSERDIHHNPPQSSEAHQGCIDTLHSWGVPLRLWHWQQIE